MKKLIILLLIIQFSQFIFGQKTTDSSVSFNHVALSVKDADQSAEFYKVRVAAMNNNDRLNLTARGISMNELTKEHLENDVIFIVGNFQNDSLLNELQNLLPIELKEQSFIFDNKVYNSPNAILKFGGSVLNCHNV